MIRARALGLLLVLGVVGISWALTCGAWRLERVAAQVAPLDPVVFERFTLVAVGTGEAHENPARRGPASALGLGDRVVLVDAGRGLADALRLAGIPPQQPDTVLLTSLLPENTVGLDDLLLTGWLAPREAPLTLVGPPGTRALAESLERAQAAGVSAREEALGLPPQGARFEVIEIGDGWTRERGGLAIRAGALPGGPLPAVAYRLEAGGRSAVVGGTGWAPDALAALAEGADVLVHGAVSPMTPQLADRLGLEPAAAERLERETALHTSIEEVGELAARARVETLVLVRLRPPPVVDLQLTAIVGRSFDGRILVPEDGDRIQIR